MHPALYALLAALCFAGAAIFLKRAFQYTSPQTAAVFSVTFTALFVWVAAAFSAPLSRMLTWRLMPFVIAGLLAPGFARVVYYVGVHRIGVSRGTALMAAQPLLAVALAIVFLGERPTWMLLVGAACVVAGGVLLARRVTDEKPWRRWDMAFPIVAAVGFAVRDVISRFGFRHFDGPILAAAAATATSTLMMWLFAALGGARDMPPPVIALRLLLLAGVCEGAAYVTMWRALATGDVSIVSPLIYAQPFFTILLALVFLRDLERVTWRIALASVLIVSGITLVMRFH